MSHLPMRIAGGLVDDFGALRGDGFERAHAGSLNSRGGCSDTHFTFECYVVGGQSMFSRDIERQ